MTYSVVEVFRTLQGEGMYSGRSAVFLRFAACNMWSGHDEHRERDAKRNNAECPRWCDTDFVGGMLMNLEALTSLIDEHGVLGDLVVFTGGEPLLQLDVELVRACAELGFTTCIETNGTVEAKPGVLKELDHICVSPKLGLEHLPLVGQMIGERTFSDPCSTTELKVVYPAYDPSVYDPIRYAFTRSYVSPEAATSSRGVSLIQHDVQKQAAQFCMDHPEWGLSLQTHKILDLP